MLKLIGWCLKAAFFALAILVASHLITWNGKTVSDQVRSTLSNAERPSKAAIKAVTKKSKILMNETKDAASKIGIIGEKSDDRSDGDTIKVEDRQELQALIHSSENGSFKE